MPALRVGTQLRLVDRDEAQLALQRHALGGAQEPSRIGRDDLFLAGDQRHPAGTLDRDDALIDLAREQAQRKADHPARVAAQPLDREVRLAGIGRAQHRGDRALRKLAHRPTNIVAPGRGRKQEGASFVASGAASTQFIGGPPRFGATRPGGEAG